MARLVVRAMNDATVEVETEEAVLVLTINEARRLMDGLWFLVPRAVDFKTDRAPLSVWEVEPESVKGGG